MSLSLRTYMVMLASNPDRLSDFVADPQTAAAKAGLSEADRAVLLSGNQQAIYERISSEK